MAIKEVSLFKQQFEALNFTTQFGAAVAGVQSGKTFVGKKNNLYEINEQQYNILKRSKIKMERFS